MDDYRKFETWLAKKHPKTKLRPDQREFIRWLLNSWMPSKSAPRVSGKKFIFRLLEEFKNDGL